MSRINDKSEEGNKKMSRNVKIALTLVLIVFVLTMSPSSSLVNSIKTTTAIASTPTNENIIAASSFLDGFLDALNTSLKGYR